MWHTIYSTKVNFFSIVVQQMGDSQIYRIYAKRLGTGVYCKLFRFGANKGTVYGDWGSAVMDFTKYLMCFNAPLNIYTGR